MSGRHQRPASPRNADWFRSALRQGARRWTSLLVVALLVAAGITTYSLATPSTPASATTPGSPGTPQAGTPIYEETFSNQNASSTPISILNYQGSAGTTGADSETYTADTPYTPAGGQCDGWILNSTSSQPSAAQDSGCASNAPYPWDTLQTMATDLGLFQGQTAAQAASNQALSEFTNNPSGLITAGNELVTKNNNIPTVAGHYYAVSADFAETNCSAATQASETFSLLVNGSPTVVGSGLDPCTAAGASTYGTAPGAVVKVVNLQSNALQVSTTSAPNLGLELYNAATSGSGNDVAFDDPKIVDVTPQLDKSFSPTSIVAGQTSTLTYTITNTSDLLAKNGWTFTDLLPSGLTATGVNSTGASPNNCTGLSISAGSGATSVSATGNLAAGQAYCTISVQVTATTPGTYTNSASNFTSLVGVNPPGSATLTVAPPASLATVKAISKVNGVAATSSTSLKAGDVVTYNITTTDSSATAGSTVLTETVPANSTYTGSGEGWSCAAGATAGTTCTETVSVGGNSSGTTPFTVTLNAPLPAGTTAFTNTVKSSVGTCATCTVSNPVVLPAISVVKSASPTTVTAAGQPVTYTFQVTNTGGVTLSNVNLADTFTSGGTGTMTSISCQTLSSPSGTCSGTSATLTPGQVATFTATYTTTQADIDKGSIANTVIASGTPPSGPAVTGTSSAAVTATQSGGLSLTKTASPTTVTSVGQVITYTFGVTNTGNVTITSLAIADTQTSPAGSLASGPTCSATTLAPGASTTCTATYTSASVSVPAGKTGKWTASKQFATEPGMRCVVVSVK